MSRATADYDYMSFDDFEEFLADKPKNERWELIGGRVVKMTVSVRWEHNYIIQNLASGIRERLRAAGSPCRTLTETFYLKERELNASLLPDVLVHCGPLPPGATSVQTPVVLVEVMSNGTEARDRMAKWHVYQRIPSLMHYVLVVQDRAHIETLDRIDGVWRGLQVIDGLEAILPLPGIGVEVPLADIYRDVLNPA
ncbi:Uma2 family endonuclease [Methylopila sp. 73B]|uniref:Uma2 family endonuclease n=1 Tax=Methylopila sp. 73B TaxID=1120792 RepID=UPI000373F83D|nr:Uma2 family endonuclease [Methylopila sp. 73B]